MPSSNATRRVLPDGRTVLWMGVAAALAALVTWAAAPRSAGSSASAGRAAAGASAGERPAADELAEGRAGRPGGGAGRTDRSADPGEVGAPPDGDHDGEAPGDSPGAGAVGPGGSATVTVIGGRGRGGGAPETGGKLPLSEAVTFARYSDDLARAVRDLEPSERDAIRQILDEKKALDTELQGLESQNGRMVDELEEAGVDPEPTAETLADQGEVSFKLHDVALRDQPLSPVAVEQLGLDDAQATAIEDIFRGTADDLRGDLAGIYADQTGDAEVGRDYSLNALVDAIRDGSSPAEFEAAVHLIAQEIAGNAIPPDDPRSGTAAEQMLREIFANEQRRREQLEELLGPELAQELLDHPELKGILHTYGGDGGGAARGSEGE